MHPASLREMVRRAREAGLSALVIQRITGVPPRTQRRFAFKEILVDQMEPRSDTVKTVGRPSVLAPALRGVIDAFLVEEPA